MKKVRIATHESRAGALEESLLEAGMFHISKADRVLEFYSDFEPEVGKEENTPVVLRNLDRVADKFGLGEKKGISRLFFAPSEETVVITRQGEKERVLNSADRIAGIEEDFGGMEEGLERLSAEMDGIGEKLMLYREVGGAASLLQSSGNLVIRVFEARGGDFDRFCKAAGEDWMIARAAKGRRGTLFLVCAHIGDSEELEEVANKANLRELRLSQEEDFGTLEKRLKTIEEERDVLITQMRRKKQELKKEVRVLKELLTAQLERDSISSNLIGMGKLKVVEGFVPEEMLPELERIEKSCEGEVLIQSSDEWSERETPPTALNNHRIFRPFELLTNLYGAPRYGEVDPTPFVAIFFLVFFGMMMSGILRGLTLAVISGLIIWKGTRGARDLGIVFLLAGLSASVWGVITGDILGGAIGFRPPIFDPLRNPVGFGFLHRALQQYERREDKEGPRRPGILDTDIHRDCCLFASFDGTGLCPCRPGGLFDGPQAGNNGAYGDHPGSE